jgi:NifU-like protein
MLNNTDKLKNDSFDAPTMTTSSVTTGAATTSPLATSPLASPAAAPAPRGRTTLLDLRARRPARPNASPVPRPAPVVSAPLPNRTREETIALIQETLEELRPHLHKDGGDCEFVDLIEGDTVLVKLIGSCGGCQIANLTVGGIRARLADKLGQRMDVIPINTDGH